MVSVTAPKRHEMCLLQLREARHPAQPEEVLMKRDGGLYPQRHHGREWALAVLWQCQEKAGGWEDSPQIQVC